MFRNVELVGEKGRSRGKKTKLCKLCVNYHIKLLGLESEWGVFKDMGRDLILDKQLTLVNLS